MNNKLRWLPAIFVPAVVVAGAIILPTAANADPSLSPKTAQQVLALIAKAKDVSYSGTVAQGSDLGLPQLPTTGTGSSSSSGSDATSTVLDLLTADHSARVYVDGASKQRLQVLDNLAERDVIRNGSTVWAYDSKAKTATKTTLPSHSAASAPTSAPTPSPTETPLTPSQLADKAIAAIDGSTAVKVITTATVAGRSVYQLELTPKSTITLVSHVVLSVDAKTGLPLKVVVDARGQKADAFTVGFTKIDFSTPAASLFTFTPPSGAKVTEHNPAAKHSGPIAPGENLKSTSGAKAKPTVTGSGWDSIVSIASTGSAAGSTGSGSKGTGGSTAKLLDELTTPVAGGRAVQTSLLSVLLLDDGRVLVGAVPISALEAAAQ